MTPRALISSAINPALELLPAHMDSPEARVMLVAISGQEAEWKFRVQADDGPAHGLWQFEKGGVRALIGDVVTAIYVRRLCTHFGVHFTVTNIWLELESNDIFAAGLARLLLWADTAPLPPIGAMGTAWSYYVRNWEPGKPGPTRWPGNYRAAVAAVTGQANGN